jgi:hypothetical protein
MFSGVNVTSSIFARLDQQFHPNNWGGTYEQVLPHVQRAFDETVIALVPQIDVIVRDEIVSVIRELCTPDLSRRGHPKGLGGPSQYSLERYKARFDLLRKRASIAERLRKTA